MDHLLRCPLLRIPTFLFAQQWLPHVKNELSFLDRAVIELHYEENYTVDDIAQKVGISVAKTKRIIAKTKDYLKKRMEEEL